MTGVFCDLTDLNWQALEWCNKQNGTYRRTVDGAPQKIHETICGEQLRMVPEDAVRFYLCPERKISFDGFVNYEGRRFWSALQLSWRNSQSGAQR